MVAHSGGETFDGLTDGHGRPASDAERNGGATSACIAAGRCRARARGGWPCGPSPVQGGTRLPQIAERLAAHAAWSPPRRSSRPSVASSTGGGRPTRASGSWPVTTRPGRRVPFGRPGAPAADLHRGRCRLLRHPRLLSAGGHRRAPVRRWRRLLAVQPRRAPRRGPRPGHRSQPHLLSPLSGATDPGRSHRRRATVRRMVAASVVRPAGCARSGPRSCSSSRPPRTWR